MRTSVSRFVWRGSVLAALAALVVFVSLTAFCAARVATLVWSAQPITGTIVGVERPVFERHRSDYRPVVQVALPGGAHSTHRFSGLYRVEPNSVGQSLRLLHNASATPAIVPDSPLNWIGAMVYGGLSLGMLALVAMLWLAGRWVPRSPVPAARGA